MSSDALKRINSELLSLIASPPQHFSTPNINDDNPFKWTIIVYGPAGSVYEGGEFKVAITFSQDYPFVPPIFRFQTRIYHCNIDASGTICMDILGDKWSPAWTVTTVLIGLVSLLSECNPYDPLMLDIGRAYLNDREEHDRTARLWTRKYAI